MDQNEELLERLYYTNMRACQVILNATEKLQDRGEYSGDAKAEMKERYTEHASNVKKIIAMLGYEPSFDDSFRRLYE